MSSRELVRSLKRVLFISPIDHRYVSVKVINFAHWLAAKGHRVIFTCLGPPACPPDGSVQYLRLPMPSGPKTLRYGRWLGFVYRVARQSDWIIGVNDPGVFLCSLLRRVGCGKFLLAMAQEHTNLEPDGLTHKIVAAGYRRADLTTDVSDEGVAYRHDRMRLAGRVIRFMNVPPLGAFAPMLRSHDGRRKLKLVYVGSLGKRNYILELVEAVGLTSADVTLELYGLELVEAVGLTSANVTLKSYGFGDSDYLTAIRSRITKLGLERAVVLRPAVDRSLLPDILAEADVGVSLTWQEGTQSPGGQHACPNKLFEYIAAGLPVLASQTLANASWLRQYEVGICVDAADPHAIAVGIQRFLVHGTVERMSQAAIRAHQEKWHLEREATSVYAMVEELWLQRTSRSTT